MNEDKREYLEMNELKYQEIDNVIHNTLSSNSLDAKDIVENGKDYYIKDYYISEQTIEKLRANKYIVTEIYGEHPSNSCGWFLTTDNGRLIGYNIKLQ